MHFSLTPREQDGLSALAATPQEYDGIPPISSLLLGGAPERIDPNLTAVSAALAFEAYVADEISLEHPVLPLTADALGEFFKPASVRCISTKHWARRMAEGQGSLTIVSEDRSSGYEDTAEKNDLGHFQLHLVDSYESPRGFAYKNRIYLPSNAALLSPRAEGDTRRLFPKIAAALSIAGEFGIREIRFPGTGIAPDDRYMVKALNLLRAVNRELIWN